MLIVLRSSAPRDYSLNHPGGLDYPLDLPDGTPPCPLPRRVSPAWPVGVQSGTHVPWGDGSPLYGSRRCRISFLRLTGTFAIASEFSASSPGLRPIRT